MVITVDQLDLMLIHYSNSRTHSVQVMVVSVPAVSEEAEQVDQPIKAIKVPSLDLELAVLKMLDGTLTMPQV